MNCRLDVFATRTALQKGRGKRPRVVTERVAWQGWNPDGGMERVMGRLVGSGSFYWPSPADAYRAATVMMRQDATIDAIRIRGIGSQDVAYLRRSDLAPRFGCHPGQPELIARF